MTLEGPGSSGCSPVLQGRFTIPVNCVKSVSVCVCVRAKSGYSRLRVFAQVLRAFWTTGRCTLPFAGCVMA